MQKLGSLRRRGYGCVTPLLIQLHWLPVPFQGQFKVLVMINKTQNSLGPRYLKDNLLTYHEVITGHPVASTVIF